jgi:hypothetical protein
LGATSGPGTSSTSAAASTEAAVSIIGKSKSSAKASLSKLGKLSLGSKSGDV